MCILNNVNVSIEKGFGLTFLLKCKKWLNQSVQNLAQSINAKLLKTLFLVLANHFLNPKTDVFVENTCLDF